MNIDFTILTPYLMVSIVIAVVATYKYASAKFQIQKNDLLFAMKILDLSIPVVAALGLEKKIPKLREIVEIIDETLHMLSEISIQNIDTSYNNALTYALHLIENNNIALSDETEALLEKLLKYSLEKIYGKEISDTDFNVLKSVSEVKEEIDIKSNL